MTSKPVVPRGATLEPASSRICNSLAQLLAQGLAHGAIRKGKRFRQSHELVMCQAVEARCILWRQRLGHGYVEQQRAHPVEAAPRVRLELGGFASDEFL